MICATREAASSSDKLLSSTLDISKYFWVNSNTFPKVITPSVTKSIPLIIAIGGTSLE